MPSLRELLTLHGKVLLIDSASAKIQIGVWPGAGRETVWRSQEIEAGTGIFALVDAALREASLEVSDVEAFAFCDGPGSVLGIRTAAVALRVWQSLRPRPAYRYNALELMAHQLTRDGSVNAPTELIADARRETWHTVSLDGSGGFSKMRRVPTAELGLRRLMPEGFRQWSVLPEAPSPVPYAVETILKRVPDAPVFEAAPEPDAFLHEEPTYKTWTPQIHRAP